MSNQYTWLMSRDKMYINGISSDTVGILVDTPPMPPMAQERVETVNIIGRADSSVFRTGMYDDLTISVTCYVFDYGTHPDAIYKYLKSAKTLSFSNANDFIYKVKSVNGVTPAYSGNGKNVLTVSFQCSPFKYAANNPELVFERGEEASRTVQIFNAGTIYAEPIYKLSATTGPVYGILTVNGEEITCPQTYDPADVYIDLSIMEAYKLVSGVKTRGNYIFGKWWNCILQTGYNEITFSGSSTLSVVKNERWL